MAQQDGQVHKVLGSEALGILLGRWRDGTFSGIADDWRWIAGYTKRYRWAVALYIVLGVAESSLSLVSAVAGKYAIDIITGYQTSRLWVLLVLMVASAVSSLLLRSAVSRISARVSLRVNNDIRAEVFDCILRADWRALNRFSSGDLLNRLSSDAGTVAGNAISWLPDLVISLYTFIATFAVILYYDWVMAVLALASAPFLLLTSRRLLGRLRGYNEDVRRSSSDVAVMTDIKPRPPIWMSRRMTHLPKSDQCTAVPTVTRPVTQVALVAVNSASIKGVARPLFAAQGSVSSSVPVRIMSAKPTAITIAACIARLFGARLPTPVTTASPLAFPIYNSLIQRLYHI